jgi:hypothetical protein
LCGDDDLTDVLSHNFSRFEIELLSIIHKKNLLDETEHSAKPTLPDLKSGELVIIESLEHQSLLTELLLQQGLQGNQHWVFS